MSFIYLLACIAGTVIARLLLEGFYNGAHVGGLSAMIAWFVIWHHFGKTRRMLGLGQGSYLAIQVLFLKLQVNIFTDHFRKTPEIMK